MNGPVISSQLRRVLSNLYDLAYLESDPLAQVLAKVGAEREGGSRGLHLRATLLGLIEDLRPQGLADVTVPEWRRYLILQEHYVLRRPWRKIEEKLSLGDRQVRREHSRALAALAVLLQSRLASVSTAGREPPEALPSVTVQETVQRLTPAPISFKLSELVQDVVVTLARIKPTGPAVEWRVAPADLAAYTDRGILHQLLLNLLRCFVAAEQRGPVTLAAAPEGAQVQVVVSGYRAPGKAGEEALRICGWLARSLGADLAVTGDDLRGYEASFALSACAPPRKVLIIDDELPAIELFTAYLEGSDYQVAGETRAEKALRRAVEFQPDVIVLDVMMPGMDGWELLQQLRHAPELEDVPIIACSVLEEAELAAALGAAGFLKKPVLRRQMVAALEEVCDDRDQSTP